MEDDPVIKTLAGQLFDPLYMSGRDVRAQVDNDATVLQVKIDLILEVLRLGVTGCHEKKQGSE